MKRFQTVVTRLFLFLVILACAAPGKTLQTSYDALQKIYPRYKSIVKVIFKKQTYFALADYGKIEKIIKIMETEENSSQLWVVLDADGKLEEVIHYPEMKRYDLTDNQIPATEKLSFIHKKYSDEISNLPADLADDWESLIQKINIKLLKVDATSQATP